MLTIITPSGDFIKADSSKVICAVLSALPIGFYQIGRVDEEIFVEDAPFDVTGRVFDVPLVTFKTEVLAALLCETVSEGARCNYRKVASGHFALVVYTAFSAQSNEIWLSKQFANAR